MKIALVALLVASAVFAVTAKPRFSSLSSVYPTYAKFSAYGLKSTMGLPGWLYSGGAPNTCAIRMSKAFIDAGLTLDHSRVTSCSGSSYAGVKGSTGSYSNKEIFIRAKFFKCYLQKIWGTPDKTSVSGTSAISGQKGLLIFTGCSGFGQHIDLWNGSSCLMGCNYFNRCSSVQMYYLS